MLPSMAENAGTAVFVQKGSTLKMMEEFNIQGKQTSFHKYCPGTFGYTLVQTSYGHVFCVFCSCSIMELISRRLLTLLHICVRTYTPLLWQLYVFYARVCVCVCMYVCVCVCVCVWHEMRISAGWLVHSPISSVVFNRWGGRVYNNPADRKWPSNGGTEYCCIL